MRLLFTPLARSDLQAIANYIAQDNLPVAIGFVRSLRERCRTIAANPGGYRQRKELGEGIRSCAHGRYIIFFEIVANEVLILRILHGARDIQNEFEQ